MKIQELQRLRNRLSQTPKGHWRGLRLRASLIRASLLDRTDDLVRKAGALVETIGFSYEELIGEISPYDFARTVLGVDGHPEIYYLRLKDHDFSRGESDLPAWSAEVDVARCLAGIAKAKLPSQVVEIGSYIGWTSSHIALALEDGPQNASMVCVDLSPRFIELCERNLAQLGLERRVTFICGGSTDPQVLSQIPPAIDLLYIDSSHDYEQTLKELNLYGQKMAKDGLIVLHDAIKLPGVRKAIVAMRDEYAAMITATSDGNGMAILKRRE